jgi:hypothetical protein
MRTPVRIRWLLIVLAAVIGGSAVHQLLSSDDSAEGRPAPALVQARELLVAVDTAELCHWQRHGRYGNLPDLDETMEAVTPSHLAGSLMSVASTAQLTLELQLSKSGKSYVQRITGKGIDTFVERRGSDFVDYGADGWRRLATHCAAPTP